MARARKLTLGPLLVLALALSVAESAGAEIKVGFVNLPKLLQEAPQTKAVEERMEREFAPKDRDLLEQQRQVQRLKDELIKNAAVMSSAERQRQESDIRAMQRELRRSQDEFREDLNLFRSQELSKLQQKVIKVIQALAKSERYDLVVTDGVVYAGPKVDITNVVLERLRAEYKTSGN